jgi:hypothetical protein
MLAYVRNFAQSLGWFYERQLLGLHTLFWAFSSANSASQDKLTGSPITWSLAGLENVPPSSKKKLVPAETGGFKENNVSKKTPACRIAACRQVLQCIKHFLPTKRKNWGKNRLSMVPLYIAELFWIASRQKPFSWVQAAPLVSRMDFPVSKATSRQGVWNWMEIGNMQVLRNCQGQLIGNSVSLKPWLIAASGHSHGGHLQSLEHH